MHPYMMEDLLGITARDPTFMRFSHSNISVLLIVRINWVGKIFIRVSQLNSLSSLYPDRHACEKASIVIK